MRPSNIKPRTKPVNSGDENGASVPDDLPSTVPINGGTPIDPAAVIAANRCETAECLLVDALIYSLDDKSNLIEQIESIGFDAFDHPLYRDLVRHVLRMKADGEGLSLVEIDESLKRQGGRLHGDYRNALDDLKGSGGRQANEFEISKAIGEVKRYLIKRNAFKRNTLHANELRIAADKLESHADPDQSFAESIGRVHELAEEAKQARPDGSFVGFVGTIGEDIPKFTGPLGSLAAELLPVPPLSPAMIPVGLRAWLDDIAQRACLPIDYPTSAALVALGSILGRNLGIRPKKNDSWTVTPNLWGKIIGEPGIIKTAAAEEALLPVRRLMAEATEAHQRDIQRAEEDHAIAEAKARAAKKLLDAEAKKRAAGSDERMRELVNESKQPEREGLTARRYIVNDATTEKLGELCKENPRGLLQFRDELSGFLRLLDRPGHEGDRAFYLEGWNGNGRYEFDRIGRGHIGIEGLCISIFGTIQPGPLASYLRGALACEDRDGFIPRFQIMVYPDTLKHFINVDKKPDVHAKERACEIFRMIDAMSPLEVGAEFDADSGLNFIHFDGDAQEFFDGWRVDLEGRVRSGNEGELMTAHLAKYRSLMPSLALIFHVVEVIGEDSLGGVSLRAAKLAAAWCDYLESHTRRVYQHAIEGDTEKANALAEKIKTVLPNPFTYRQVVIKGWKGLDSTEEVRKAVGLLEDRNWVKVKEYPAQGGNGGRPSEKVWINPEALKDREAKA